MSLGIDPKLPNYRRPEHVKTEPDLKLIQDELGGTRAMHEASSLYIRKWAAEKTPNYNIRRKCETFFEGLGRTLSAAVGMLFARPPEVEWNAAEERMADHWGNIDSAGTAGVVFLKRFSEASIRDGIGIILVDHPPMPDDVEKTEDGGVTSDVEEARNLRPTWSVYSRAQAINWRADVVNNKRTLTLLVLHETVQIPVGTYGMETRDRFRVLSLTGGKASWVLYEQNVQGAEQFKEMGKGDFTNRTGEPADRIPVAIAYTGRTDAPMQATIPLLGVAWANLAHWQLSTSLRFNSEVAGLAQPTVIGELARDANGVEKPLEIGPLVSVHLATGGEFKFTEAEGTGLERLSLLAQEKLREMAALGMSFLQRDTRAAETAEAKRLDASAENSTLATAAQGIADAANEALALHWWYLGGEKEGAPTLRLNPEYEDMTMPPDLMRAYVEALKAGLPEETFLKALHAGGRLPEDADPEELALLMIANRAAAEAQAQADREANFERQNLNEAA